MSAKGFDKNSIIGLVLIGAIMFVFSYINNPSEEDIRAQKEQEAKQEQIDTQQKEELSAAIVNPDTLTETIIDSAIINNLDSANNSKLLAEYGSFAKAAVGEKKELILENEKIMKQQRQHEHDTQHNIFYFLQHFLICL